MSVSRSTARARAQKKAAEADLGFNWGLPNSVLLGLGLVTLVVGYLALSRGSITLAPVLLPPVIPAARNPVTGAPSRDAGPHRARSFAPSSRGLRG